MRAVVNVATGAYVKGQERLINEVSRQGFEYVHWRDKLPGGSPSHKDVPYAFKAYALKQAAEEGYKTLLWADACILPIKPLDELWQRIERDGYWIGNNGFTNATWTADSAYPDLFLPGPFDPGWSGICDSEMMKVPRLANQRIRHVVATSFGVSLDHFAGKAIFDEYYRLASTTKAFCGPWTNGPESKGGRTAPCGPSDVRGHRHDQTALSVIAWRLGCELTNSPEVFAYRGGETEQTILVADGAY